MMDLQAALGLHQLAAIARMLERREAIWRALRRGASRTCRSTRSGARRRRRSCTRAISTPCSSTAASRAARATSCGARCATAGICDERALPGAAPAPFYARAFRLRRAACSRTPSASPDTDAVAAALAGDDRRRRSTASIEAFARRVGAECRTHSAAGRAVPRRPPARGVGFGHLVRSRALARALGVAAPVSLRGSATTARRRARSVARVLAQLRRPGPVQAASWWSSTIR